MSETTDLLDEMNVEFSFTESMKPVPWSGQPALPHGNVDIDNDWANRVLRADSKRMFSWVGLFTRTESAKSSGRWPSTTPVIIASYAVDFWTGSGLITKRGRWSKPTPPSPEDILSSVAMSESALDLSIGDWAEDFGYSDGNVREAVRTYDACRLEAEKYRGFFTDEERASFAKALEDY